MGMALFRMRRSWDFMSEESWKSSLEVLAQAAAAATILFSLLALMLSRRIDRQKNEQLRQFEADLTTAKTELGRQQVRAAEAEKVVAGLKVDVAKADAKAEGFRFDIAKADEHAASAQLETARLYALTAPRRLNLEQQNEIATALRRFSKRTVVLETYGLDGEGAAIGTQLINVLRSAGITTIDHRASMIVSGGFEFGIHIRGPQTEQEFVVGLRDALRSIGNLEVSTNDGSPRPTSAMAGPSVMAGPSAMAGVARAPGPPGATPPGTPVTIMVGIKPVQIAAEK